MTAPGGPADHVNVLLGDGTGGFEALSEFPTGDSFGLTLADVNGDDYVDVVTVTVFGENIIVLLGDGAGGFGPVSALAAGGERGSMILEITNGDHLWLADINGDGHLDAAMPREGIMVLLGDGADGFGPPSTFASGSDSVALADFNGDGYVDVVTTDRLRNDIIVLINRAGIAQVGSPVAGLTRRAGRVRP